MKTRLEIKAIAKPMFKNYIGVCALTLVLYMLLSLVSSVAALLIVPVLSVGLAHMFLCVYTGSRPGIRSLLMGFERYGAVLGGMLKACVFTFLWSLLLIVPGIIKGIRYSMTPFLLADCYGLRGKDAVNLSKRITKGYGVDIFVFALSYIGWALLCSSPSIAATFITVLFRNTVLSGVFGMVGAIASILLMLFVFWPYFMTGFAGLYLELKENAIANGAAAAEEFG